MKPRIYKKSILWYCEGNGIIACSLSPSDAYRKWRLSQPKQGIWTMLNPIDEFSGYFRYVG